MATLDDYRKVVDDIVQAREMWCAWNDGNAKMENYHAARDQAAQSLIAIIQGASIGGSIPSRNTG